MKIMSLDLLSFVNLSTEFGDLLPISLVFNGTTLGSMTIQPSEVLLTIKRIDSFSELYLITNHLTCPALLEK